MATATLVLAACTGGDTGGGASVSPGASSSVAAGKGAGSFLKVGLAYDIGGRGDKSFNDSAAAGLDRARAELGIQYKELSAAPDEDEDKRAIRLRLLARGGYNPVIAVGFFYADALKKVAPEFPNTRFAIVDSQDHKQPNVTNLVFAENEGSYLVGLAAALASKTHSVGFIGGCDIPVIKKFEAGFKKGAASLATTSSPQKITFQSKYLSEKDNECQFSNVTLAKEEAAKMYGTGVDVIFHAAGKAGTGVFEAAKDTKISTAAPSNRPSPPKGTSSPAASQQTAVTATKFLAIGVDSDQFLSAPPDLQPVILTSMLKRVDTAVFETIKAQQAGKPLTGVQNFDLKKDGVGYATSGSDITPFIRQLNTAKEEIIAGKIQVPVTPEP